jgi:hypothetical protein
MSKVDKNRVKFATIRLTENECKNLELYIEGKRLKKSDLKKSDFIRKCIFTAIKDIA